MQWVRPVAPAGRPAAAGAGRWLPPQRRQLQRRPRQSHPSAHGAPAGAGGRPTGRPQSLLLLAAQPAAAAGVGRRPQSRRQQHLQPGTPQRVAGAEAGAVPSQLSRQQLLPARRPLAAQQVQRSSSRGIRSMSSRNATWQLPTLGLAAGGAAGARQPLRRRQSLRSSWRGQQHSQRQTLPAVRLLRHPACAAARAAARAQTVLLLGWLLPPAPPQLAVAGSGTLSTRLSRHSRHSRLRLVAAR